MMNTDSVYFCNYSIGENVGKEIADVCSRHGKKMLLIGGEKALAAGKERLLSALADTGIEIVDTVLFGADCTYDNIHKWASYAKERGVDMIVGMGGGKRLWIQRKVQDMKLVFRCLLIRRSHLPVQQLLPCLLSTERTEALTASISMSVLRITVL